MKLSERWLREWADPPLGTEELVARLTTAGLEVEGVEPVVPAALEGVVVGEVLSVEPHPGADRLQVCRVAAGGAAPRSVVCGAPNVRAGLRAPLALPGARLPGGVEVARSEIRGVASEGMLCSPRELGLGEHAGGLMELPAEARAGETLGDCLGLDDVSIDIAITPNRGDCLGVEGIAREVAVLTGSALTPPPLAPVSAALEDRIEVALEAPEDCPRYTGRVIRDIDPGAVTPTWMQERLRRSGLRSISPVVDVTNYVMLELGQPMHAFDLERLEGRIRVRGAREGERLVLLDERELALRPGTLVIADETRPVGLAGIMGGLQSSVTAATRHIFLESAFFEPRRLAGSARGYGLQTDSSYRFERGVSPAGQRRAAERATALLLDIVGGRPGPMIEQVEETLLPARPAVRLRAARLRALLGIEVAPQAAGEVLRRLGMDTVEEADGWRVTPPAFRFDIAIEADLIEEIARVRGYDEVPSHRPRAPLVIAPRPEARVSRARLRAALVERGYQEAITYSFVDPRLQAQLDPQGDPVALANPISSDMAVMRTGLWPGLLQALLHNVNRQQERVRLFEIGLAYGRRDGQLAEEGRIGGIVTGPAWPEQWAIAPRAADLFDVKADVEALLGLTGRAGEFGFVPRPHPALHPGQAAAIEQAGRPAGWLGRLHPRAAGELKLPAAVFLFELPLAVLRAGSLPRYRPVSRYPAVRRDLAVVVDERVPVAAVRKCVGQVAPDVLQNLQLFDVYRGEGIDSGKKSLALGLTFQAPSRTLNDEEIDASVGRIIEALQRELSATLRG